VEYEYGEEPVKLAHGYIRASTHPPFTMIILVLLLAGIVIALIVSTQNANERKELWSTYQQSLRAGDKAAALRVGRAY
jgi:hypothetical protein